MRRPPKSYGTLSFELDEEEVEALHHRLDALINGRRRIVRLASRDEPDDREVIKRNRIELVQQAAVFIGDLCGDWIKLSENDGEDALDIISLNLRLWQPALAMHDQGDYFWDEVIEEIERMRFGDEPDLLKPTARPPGSHRQPAKLTFRRLTALQWEAFLKTNGVKPGEAHRVIALSYGTDWDAIRKWKSAASRMFGDKHVETVLSNAREGFGLRFIFPDYSAALHFHGEIYREVAGITKIPLEAYRNALGIGKNSS